MVMLWLLLTGAARPRPAVPPPAPLPSPVVEERALSSGAPVWVLPQDAVPLVRIEVSWGQGYLAQEDRTAAMVAGTLAGRSPDIDWDALAEMGGVAQIGVGAQRAWADIEVLSGHEDAAVAWLAEAIRAPQFSRADVRALRRRWAKARRGAWRSIGRVHNLILSTELYPAGHPLDFRPSAEDWRAVRPGRVARAWDALLEGGAVSVVVSGDTTAAAILPPLDAALSGYAGAGRPEPVPMADWHSEGRVVIVDHPGARRAWITHTRPAPGLDDGSAPLSELANHVLGGSFTSRLSARLREEEGLVYSIDSVLLTWPGSGRIEVTCSVGLGDVAAALRGIEAEVAGMAQRPPTPEEIAASAATLRMEAARSRLRLSELSRPYGLAQVFGQPASAPQGQLEAIGAASAAAVAGQAEALFGGGGGLWVVTGDAVALTDALTEAGFEIDAVRDPG